MEQRRIQMNKAIISLAASNPPMRDYSHSAGWCHKWQDLTGADVLTEWDAETLSMYDRVAIWNDVNGSEGKLNLMGFQLNDEKTGQKIQKRINELNKHFEKQGGVCQLDYAQSYYTCMSKRGLKAYEWMDEIPYVKQTDINKKQIAIGDSHTTSITPSGWASNRNDGQTLHGALKRGLRSYLTGNEEEVVFKFGDIDLRHHSMRQEDPTNAIEILVREYLVQMMDIQQVSNIKVYACEAMPQTPDSRVIPKTGFYKGEAYYGTLEQRQEMTQLFNKLLHRSMSNVVSYDGKYYDADGCLDVTKMESKRSFHLAPHSYNNKWLM